MKSVTRSVANGVQGLATGVWAVVATPFVYNPLRPVTKQAIKGGFWIAHGTQSLVEMTQEEWHDLVNEAQKEVHAEDPALSLQSDASTVSQAKHTNGEPAGGASELAPSRKATEPTAPSDLTEVKGIGDDYARLLEAAGLTSIEELAARDPDGLRTLLLDTNETHAVVGRVPSTGRIRGWIERAGEHIE